VRSVTFPGPLPLRRLAVRSWEAPTSIADRRAPPWPSETSALAAMERTTHWVAVGVRPRAGTLCALSRAKDDRPETGPGTRAVLSRASVC